MSSPPKSAFLCTLCVLAACFSSCEDSELPRRLSEANLQKVEEEQRLALLKVRLEILSAAEKTKLTEAAARIQQQEEQLVALREKFASLLTAADSSAFAKRTELEEKRAGWRGKKLERLELLNGRQLEKVTIVSISDLGIEVRHIHGSARLGTDDLSVDQHEKFGLVEELEKTARAEEHKNLAAYQNRMQASASVSKPGETTEHQDAAARSRHLAFLAEQARINREAANRPLAQPPKQFGTGSIYSTWRYRSRYYPRRTVRYYDVGQRNYSNSFSRPDFRSGSAYQDCR